MDTWTVTGLRGTGSHDFTVTDVFVPERRAFIFPGGPPRERGPLYRWVALLLVPQASLPLGIARGAIDAFIELAQVKKASGTTSELREQPVIQLQVGQAEALLGSARAYLYDTLTDVWEVLVAGDEPSLEQRGRLRLAMSHAVASAVQAVDLVYAAAGSTAIYAASPLDRYFRDVHTAAAHWTVSPRLIEATGRICLGLEPGPAFF